MEGRASNFEHVFTHFKSALKGANYAAVDMELTGCDILGKPDTYEESAAERLSKLCRIAERHVPIQLGVTLVAAEGNYFRCTAYNFYAFPSEGPEGISFQCRVSALRFNAGHNIDFNAWIRDGVPYMTREDEARYLSSPHFSADDHRGRAGLLRLWEALCDARVPLVIHGPLDLFFLLTSFERRRLPSDPRELAKLVKRCFPLVFDVAHLYGSIGDFQNLRLTKFLEEARSRHEQLAMDGYLMPIGFKLDQETAARYSSGSAHAHEAGYDSLATAQLYAYLSSLSPEKVREGANRLFLYKSVECLDLDRAETFGGIGTSAFDPSYEAPRVARVQSSSVGTAVQLLTALGWEYRRLDASHLLVVLRYSDCDADSCIADVAAQAGDAIRWLSVEEWRNGVRQRQARNAEDVSGEATPSSGSRAPSRAEKWFDSPSEPRFAGAIKSFNPASGFGFIDCPETFARFNRDVFLHHSQMGDCVLGQQVSFEVAFNSRGQPQAKAVRALDADLGMARRLLGEMCQLKSEADNQDCVDGLTTEVCSVANISDVESSKNGSVCSVANGSDSGSSHNGGSDSDIPVTPASS